MRFQWLFWDQIVTWRGGGGGGQARQVDEQAGQGGK